MNKKVLSKLIVLFVLIATVLSFSSVVFAKGLTAEQREMRDKFRKS